MTPPVPRWQTRSLLLGSCPESKLPRRTPFRAAKGFDTSPQHAGAWVFRCRSSLTNCRSREAARRPRPTDRGEAPIVGADFFLPACYRVSLAEADRLGVLRGDFRFIIDHGYQSRLSVVWTIPPHIERWCLYGRLPTNDKACDKRQPGLPPAAPPA